MYTRVKLCTRIIQQIMNNRVCGIIPNFSKKKQNKISCVIEVSKILY